MTTQTQIRLTDSDIEIALQAGRLYGPARELPNAEKIFREQIAAINVARSGIEVGTVLQCASGGTAVRCRRDGVTFWQIVDKNGTSTESDGPLDSQIWHPAGAR